MSIEEIDFDDEFDDLTSEPTGLEPQEPLEDDLTTEVLRLKGIADPEKIKFEDESGAVIERPWDTLSRDEQLNILTQTDPIEAHLSDDEIDLLNAIRNSGNSVQSYLNSLLPVEEKHYDIESLSDEDVYAIDLLDKVGKDNISLEELAEAINIAKQNENLFKKTVEGLRKEYIDLQKDEEARKANALAQEQENKFRQFAASILNEIRGLNSFAGQELELSQQDADDLAAFMLDLDESGMSAFGKALQDHHLFTKAAFWLLNEDLIVEELTRLMQENYTRGYEAAKKELSSSSVVIKTPKNNEHDEFVDDDDW